MQKIHKKTIRTRTIIAEGNNQLFTIYENTNFIGHSCFGSEGIKWLPGLKSYQTKNGNVCNRLNKKGKIKFEIITGMKPVIATEI